MDQARARIVQQLRVLADKIEAEEFTAHTIFRDEMVSVRHPSQHHGEVCEMVSTGVHGLAILLSEPGFSQPHPLERLERAADALVTPAVAMDDIVFTADRYSPEDLERAARSYYRADDGLPRNWTKGKAGG